MHCLPLLLEIEKGFDGFLCACYADHPLVRLLQSYISSKPVVGIFDATIMAGLQLVSDESKFGIITTGVLYEALLQQSVEALLGAEENISASFGGVAASEVGLNDLQYDSRRSAKEKVMNATRRLLQNNPGQLNVIIMGGVILAGMEPWVHEASVLELGMEKAKSIKVIDQLRAGLLTLMAMLRDQNLHSLDYRLALI